MVGVDNYVNPSFTKLSFCKLQAPILAIQPEATTCAVLYHAHDHASSRNEKEDNRDSAGAHHALRCISSFLLALCDFRGPSDLSEDLLDFVRVLHACVESDPSDHSYEELRHFHEL